MSVIFNEHDDAESSMCDSALIDASAKADLVGVVLVERDQTYREMLAKELSERGFVVRSFGDHRSLLHSLDIVDSADVIVLDGGGAAMDGIDFMAGLRRRGVMLPVVFLISEALLAYECLALDRGAIDVICKSRGLDVVTKRLKRAVETVRVNASPVAEESLVCGKLRLRPMLSRAYWNDIDVDLTLGEYKIVHLLASRVGRYISYRAAYDRLHYDGFIAGSGPHGYRANVRSAIKRIRNKFRALDADFDKIENFAGFGYRWRTSD